MNTIKTQLTFLRSIFQYKERKREIEREKHRKQQRQRETERDRETYGCLWKFITKLSGPHGLDRI